jgi:preprotein translocase subunit YajC
MSQTTIYVPFAFARSTQDPQSRSDNPTPTPGSTGTSGSTQMPTTGATGTAADPNGQNQPADNGCGGGMMWMMPMFLVLMYFMMIRPEQKRKKAQQALLSSIKVGDTVVMLSGMHSAVTSLDDKTVTVRTEDGSLIKFDRSSVARIVRDDAEAAPAK